ncbi:glycoside hydrolase family 97 protein [uncultured Parabacteroides sp.]|mgnify:CR=1 FL=1|uniref:glycoside hydrolase family 97 protein n=1 Tax=uncultured Parabacteroides sp. TaxID=512312 RepID=UPI00258FE966|nr:glycoside hydrolase family 97 protein [uncultured Parabacteroides sp.]
MKKVVSISSSLWLLFLLFAAQMHAATQDVYSPDRKLKVSVNTTGQIAYSVYAGDNLLLKDCSLRLDLGDEVLGTSAVLKTVKRGTINETIKPEITFKNAVVENNCNTLLLNFKGDFSIEFRVFDDGVAYRFITARKGQIDIYDETCGINFGSDYLAHISQPNSFKTSYEYPYTHIHTTDYKANDKMTYLPILLESEQGYKILISEADLSDYPCMFFKSTGRNGLTSVFPNCPLEFGEDGDRSLKIVKEADYIARTSGNRSFPWRFFMITKDDRQLIGNDMVCKLSSQNVLGDVSWVKPGHVAWEWWHDAALYGVDFKSGYNMDSYKYYIDFASANGIPYMLMDEGWAETTYNPFIPNPTIDLFELISYAKERNVKIVLWLTWLAVENNFDLFQKFNEWGIAGVKIDFMDRSDQWMVNYYERVAKEAAKHHLFVDFHGSFKPAGLEHKYPNVISYEGVLGMEQGNRCIPDNSIYQPFMRNFVGPMDYTPGSMISAHPEDVHYTRTNAMSVGTRAYQLALYVVFESGLQMLADNPIYYNREKDCLDFMASVPVVWDETRCLYAKVGEAVVVARRKGDKWYIGGISGSKGKEVTINLDFLPEGKEYNMDYFQDGVNAERQAMDYKKESKKVNASSSVTIRMVRNGGWAATLE